MKVQLKSAKNMTNGVFFFQIFVDNIIACKHAMICQENPVKNPKEMSGISSANSDYLQ